MIMFDFVRSRTTGHSFAIILSAAAFRIWRSDPSRLVGFFPFLHSSAGKEDGYKNGPVRLEKVQLGTGSYSLVSNRAAFVHRLYLNALSSFDQESCQHVLLSLQVAAISAKPPVAVTAHPRELLDVSRNFPSLRGEHGMNAMEQRANCRFDWIQANELMDLPKESAMYLGSG
jgi:hypothetical protein